MKTLSNIVLWALIGFALLVTYGCVSMPDGSKMPSGTFGCYEGLYGKVIGGNIAADTVGTKGGRATIKCGAGEVTFQDSGDLSAVAGQQSIRVPVEATPMKLHPKTP